LQDVSRSEDSLAEGGVEVGGTRIAAGKIIIATGASGNSRDIPSRNRALSDEHDGARSRDAAAVTAGDR
jgi:hypothetical protein